MPLSGAVQPEHIEQLYDAALSSACFDQLLDLLEQLIPDGAILLFGEDTTSTAGNFLLQRRMHDDAVRSYVSGLAVRNPWFQQQWRQPQGRVFQDHQLLSREAFIESAFYKDWLSRYGQLDCATGLVVQRDGVKQLVLEVRYSSDKQRLLRPQVTEVLEDLAPHITRMAMMFHLRRMQMQESDYSRSLLEMMTFPVFIIDAARRIHLMNAKAEALCHRMDALFVSADGCLHAIAPGPEATLRNATQKLLGVRQRGAEVICIGGSDQGKYLLTLTTLSGQAKQDLRFPGAFDGPGQRFAVVVQNSVDAPYLSHEALWRAFGLTSAEADLAISLLEGDTIGDYALRQKVSKQTLRNRLVTVMRKTETSRQPQLVALLTRLALSLPN